MSAVTIEFLAWCSHRLRVPGVTASLLIWNDTSWDHSLVVRRRLRQDNQ
jgi:hypothetical protein